MKKVIVIFYYLLLPLLLLGQASPRWINDAWRAETYPYSVYYSAFVSANATQETERSVENAAKRKVMESIRVNLKSKQVTRTENYGTQESYREYNKDEVQSSAEAEIVGIKVETHRAANVIYAFAYVNRYELVGYYKSNLSVNIGQIESFVQTAQSLETNGEKAKARQQLEAAQPLFAKVRQAQDLLTAVDANASREVLQQAKTESLYSLLTQMQARLAQGVYIFISGSENLFGKSENIIANRVKADLAHKGCSFVDKAAEADYHLKIYADVRLSSQGNNLAFCFADVEVELLDIHKQKAVFADEFSEKSGSSSQEKAGRKAMESAAEKVAGKLNSWIQN